MKQFFRTIPGLALCFALCFSCQNKPDEVTLTIFCTTDTHGSLFNYDLKQDRPSNSSMANVAACLKQARDSGINNYILLDAGDFLQGQPSNYYFNFIDTAQINITARVMNYLGYDAAAVGNHDIEAGHHVYDKAVKELNFPWLAANAVHAGSGEPYFKPYTIIERSGLKIAVLGLITPGIPKWLPANLWTGIEFKDMIETARKWVPVIQEKEKPDLLIGLFHSGFDYNYAGEDQSTLCNENASMLVAQQVDGFDIVIMGHDHQEKVEEITNDAGNRVLLIDPRSHASALGKITVRLKKQGEQYIKSYQTELIDLAQSPQDSAYINEFAPDLQLVREYINTPLGEFTEELSSREGLLGPSAFTDLIHNIQLAVTGADISFSTVLQMDAQIKKGTVTIRDMFNLYKFENGLYIMNFTGEEIRRYLEYAAQLQYNTMQSASDHLLNFKTDTTGKIIYNGQGKAMLDNDYFNFSCAAGIRYTVDVSKKSGDRIKIHSLSNRDPFHPDSTYLVAINSYRANGGGGHLTLGAGLSKSEINTRIVSIKERDVRYYIMEYIKEMKIISPKIRHDWEVIPTSWFNAGKERDYRLLYDQK